MAANASYDSGYYPMYTIGNDPNPWNGNGTSASAPLYAGLFAVINAALGAPVGFVNPVLYALGNTVCHDINPAAGGGPGDNGINGVAGYPARARLGRLHRLGHHRRHRAAQRAQRHPRS